VGTDEEKAHRLLERAKQGCLITNSFKAETVLTTVVNTGVQMEAQPT
jgi:organic hydroperoxide reductase OsmC/OhrA